MRGTDITEKQLTAAKQYVLLRRAHGNTASPEPSQNVAMTWQSLLMLVAEYGAIRARSVQAGGSVDEPGEVYLTGKEEQ